jgi:hypothetical protein
MTSRLVVVRTPVWEVSIHSLRNYGVYMYVTDCKSYALNFCDVVSWKSVDVSEEANYPATCCILAWHILLLRIWKRLVFPKLLRCLISQKVALLITTVVRTSNPILFKRKVVGLERGPLSLVSTTEELLDRKVAAPVYKTENTAVGTRHADHVAPSIRKKLAITSPTCGGCSVGIVRSRTQTMEFF